MTFSIKNECSSAIRDTDFALKRLGLNSEQVAGKIINSIKKAMSIYQSQSQNLAEPSQAVEFDLAATGNPTVLLEDEQVYVTLPESRSGYSRYCFICEPQHVILEPRKYRIHNAKTNASITLDDLSLHWLKEHKLFGMGGGYRLDPILAARYIFQLKREKAEATPTFNSEDVDEALKARNRTPKELAERICNTIQSAMDIFLEKYPRKYTASPELRINEANDNDQVPLDTEFHLVEKEEPAIILDEEVQVTLPTYRTRAQYECRFCTYITTGTRNFTIENIHTKAKITLDDHSLHELEIHHYFGRNQYKINPIIVCDIFKL